MGGRPRPSRKTALWLLGALALVALAVLLALDRELMRGGAPGIATFELAFSSERAREILAQWGTDRYDTARASLIIDFAFIVGWAGFLALLCRVAADRQLGARFTRAGAYLAWVAIAAGVFDLLEDLALLRVIATGGDQPWPALAGTFASAKFLGIAAVLGYLALALLGSLRTRGQRRRSERVPSER